MPQDRNTIVERLESAGLVAIVRASSSEGLIETCRALRDGGVQIAEITMTTPGALDTIAATSAEFADQFLIGVGSVLDAQTAVQAIDAGAQFVVCPIFRQEVLDAGHRLGKPVLPGALTPAEIQTAWEAGADIVKVFPANHFGPRYFKDVLAPLPHLKLTPTGGVDLETVSTWFRAGAACLGVGSSLVKKDLIAQRDWSALTSRARQFVKAVETARA